MNEENLSHNLVEHILELLHLLQENHIDPACLTEGELPALPLPNLQYLEATCEIIRFMDEMPGGFLIYRADESGQIIYANRGLLRILQCESMAQFQALTGGSFQGMVHPEDVAVVEQSIREQVDENQHNLDYVEYRVTRRDGAVRWIEDYGHFIHSETVGNIFYVFLSDATEKRDRYLIERNTLISQKEEKEQKLQNLIEEYDKERALINQEYLRRLKVIEGLSVNYESILYVDLEKDKILPYRLSSRTRLQFNGDFQMRDFSWYTANYVDTWVHPEDRDRVARATSPQHIHEKLAASATYYINYRAIQNGETQYLQLRLVNVGPGAPATQIVMGYRRVDDEIRREMEQNQMLAEALHNANLAMVAKNTFLSNMSHDIRTPLNAILGFTGLAERNLQTAGAVQGYLEKIKNASQQLLDMVDKLLEISWNDSHETAQPSTCNLREILQEVYEFLAPQAQEKNIDFSLDCTGLRHADVYGDPQKLKQLVLYLSNNAVTYTKPGGRVKITATQQEELHNQYAVYQFVVADTGVGISEEFLERIFEPFAREKNTTLSGIHGAGLGLTIAKNIVDMLGGSIDAKSKLGEGSTFTATFRLRQQTSTASLPPAGPSRPGAHPARRKILIAEDNELNLEIETELLQELGFLVESAPNGRMAVEKVRNSTPGEYDLILMDIQMPEMDGWQAAKAIRSLENQSLAQIPIIALSANVFESDIQRSMECGMDAHLKKPLDVPYLLKTMEETIQQRAAKT